jgi:hypothetical protein
MNLQEITNLIQVRNYIMNAITISTIDRKTVNELSNMLILTDKKLITLLQSSDFKDYIEYQNAKQALSDVVKMNNIKSSLNNR